MRKFMVLLCVPFIVAGCGNEEAVTGIAELVPADAAIIVTLSSIDEVQGELAKLAATCKAPLQADPVAMMLMGSGVNMAQVDRTLPVAIAFSPPNGRPGLLPSYILPMKNAKSAAASFQMGTATACGTYTVFSLGAGGKTGGSALAKGMRAGDLSIRLDLKRLIALYGEQITAGLGMAQAMMSQQGDHNAQLVAEQMTQNLDDLMGSADVLDLVLDSGHDGFNLDFMFTAIEGSPLAQAAAAKSTLAELAAWLPEDFPVVALFKYDMHKWTKMFASMYDSMAEAWTAESGQALQDHMQKSLKWMEGLNGEWLMAGDVGSDGIRAVMAARAGDGAVSLSEYTELMTAPAMAAMGWTVIDEGTCQKNGFECQRLRMNIDPVKLGELMRMCDPSAAADIPRMQEMLGMVLSRDGIVVDMAAKGDQVLWVVGADEDLMARVLSYSAAPKELAACLNEAGGELKLLLRFELASLIGGIREMAVKMGFSALPEVNTSKPLPVVVYATSEGRGYRGSLSVDLEKVISFFNALK